MKWIEEYELLFNLACDWEREIILNAPLSAKFSEDNPYSEPLKVAYKAVIGREK